MHRSFVLRGVLARSLSVAAGIGAVLVCSRAHAGVVTWTGTGGSSWANSSWSVSGGPGTTDTASFTNTGSVSFAGTTTSILNANRTIGGLAFVNSSGDFHTLDLGGFTLTENGILSFNENQSGNTITTIQDGTLTLGGASADVYAGYSSSGTAVSVADLSGLSAFNGTLQNFYVGVTATANSATATLNLSNTNNNITANLFQIGEGISGGGYGNGTLHLGKANTVTASQMIIGEDYSTGLATIATGGTFNLGSSTSRTDLYVGSGALNTNSQFTGELNLTGGTFNAYLGNLIVGQKTVTGGYGGGAGTLLGGSGGSVNIGATGNTANFIVGMNSAGGDNTNASGTVDFSGVTTLAANLNQFEIGTDGIKDGSAQGTVSLATSNNINALSIVIGKNGGSLSTLNLGTANTIVTPSFTIGGDYSSGIVTIAGGGTLNLGNSSARTNLYVGSGAVNTNNQFAGTLNLAGGTFNAYLANLIVGQKTISGGYGGGSGTLIGGSGGSVNIGATGNTANFIVGMNSAGGDNTNASGTVDFSGVTTLTANLNQFNIGIDGIEDGSAQGTVTLAANNNINAMSILIGELGGSLSTLNLGMNNTIVTQSFTIGGDASSGSAKVASGGTLNLGNSSARADLYVGTGTVNTNSQFTGKLDLTGATFNGYLGQLVVGQKDITGGYGGGAGSIVGATGGSVDIGPPGNTADFYVGRTLDGGGNTNAQGVVDFSGLSTLNANLNSLAIGVAVSTPGAYTQGNVSLAQSDTINASSIIVGSSGNATDTLVLGKSNTILTNQFIVGQDYSTGSVTIPSGGTLTLGSAVAPVNLTIAQGNTNTSNTYGGTFDLTGATLTGYFGNIIIGNKNTQPGNESGTFTISNNPGNYISANNITLGGNQSTGTLNYGGGVFYANTIAAGAGTANFNWTGGTLSVGTFGTLSIPFNLNNTGTGTLAPGTAAGAIGTTNIYGNYTQAASAATTLRISGDSPVAGNDLVNISGTASLAGTLNLVSTNSFVPVVGDNFLLETYASHTGSFAFVAPPTLPANVAFVLDYSSPTQLFARTVTPVAQNFISTAALSTLNSSSIWNTATVPTTSSALTINGSGSVPQTVTLSGSTTVHAISLQGGTSTLDLEVPTGINLGVANQITVGNNAILSGGGQIFGNVVVGTGGMILPGDTTSAVGTIAVGNLTFNSGATFNAEFGAAANDEFVAKGLAINPGVGVNLFQVGTNSAFDTNGVYTLAQLPAGTSVVGANNLSVLNPVAGSGYIFGTASNGSLLNLTIISTINSTWTNGDATASWNDASDWSLSQTPNGALATANFNAVGAGAVNLNGTETVGVVNLNSAAGYTFNPGSGGTLTFYNGSNPAQLNDSNGNHAFNVPVQLNSNLAVNVANAANTVTLAGNLTGSNGITLTGAGTLEISGPATYSGATNVNGGTLVLSAPGSFNGSGALNIASAGKVALAETQSTASVGSLTITSGGTFDISNNALLINYAATGQTSPDAAIRADLITGSGAGGVSSNGVGIMSSTAAKLNAALVAVGGTPKYGVGYVDGSDPYLNNEGPAAGTEEVKFTLLGDLNLDGNVNSADFILFANSFGKSGGTAAAWDHGDLNYDGNVNSADFILFADNFGQSLGSVSSTSGGLTLAQGGLDAAQVAQFNAIGTDLGISSSELATLDQKVAAVPEPGSCALLGLVGLSVLARRRRRHI